MKTPGDLTEKQKELIGLYATTRYEFINDKILMISTDAEKPLHKKGIKLKFMIWQPHGIVGKAEVYFEANQMAHAFNFLRNRARFETMENDIYAIDELLNILEQSNETE